MEGIKYMLLLPAFYCMFICNVTAYVNFELNKLGLLSYLLTYLADMAWQAHATARQAHYRSAVDYVRPSFDSSATDRDVLLGLNRLSMDFQATAVFRLCFGINAINWLKRLVSEVTCYVSSGTLNSVLLTRHVHSNFRRYKRQPCGSPRVAATRSSRQRDCTCRCIDCLSR